MADAAPEDGVVAGDGIDFTFSDSSEAAAAAAAAPRRAPAIAGTQALALAITALDSMVSLVEQQGSGGFDAELGAELASIGGRLVAASHRRKSAFAGGSASFAESDDGASTGTTSPRVSFSDRGAPSARERKVDDADDADDDGGGFFGLEARVTAAPVERARAVGESESLDMSLSFPPALMSVRGKSMQNNRKWRSASPKHSPPHFFSLRREDALRKTRSERGNFELLAATSSATRHQSLSFMPPEKEPEAHYPYMLSPLSRCRIAWDISMVFFLCYVLVMEPFRLGYDPGGNAAVAGIDAVLDTFFLVDLVMNFRTGFYDRDMELVMDPRRCALNYVTTWFLLDFVSSIPPVLSPVVELVSGRPPPGGTDYLQVAKLAKFFKVLRVLKFFKMNQDSPVGEMVEELTASTSLQFFMKFFSIIGRTAMLAHLMACFMAASGAGFLKTYSPWGRGDADGYSVMRRYLAGFYQGRKRVIRRRFNVGVLEAISERKASTL